jgi:hypothetical protein
VVAVDAEGRVLGLAADAPVEVGGVVAAPVELLAADADWSTRLAAVCDAATFCCASSAIVSAVAQSPPAAGLLGPLLVVVGGAVAEADAEGDAESTPLGGDSVSVGVGEPAPAVEVGAAHAAAAAARAFCATASCLLASTSALEAPVVVPVLPPGAELAPPAELVVDVVAVRPVELAELEPPALELVAAGDAPDDVGDALVLVWSVSSVAFALSNVAVAATTASFSGAGSSVARVWPLVTVAPTCAATVATVPETGNDALTWSTLRVVPVTDSSCVTSPVATAAVR